MDRQTIIETNRSLRTIKNELENLLEKGVITEDAYDNFHATLPAETPLHGAASRAAPSASTPVQNSNPTSPPPTQAMAALNVQPTPSPAPPSYAQTGPPSLPVRSTEKPILAHARALYRYAGADARDVAFERDDRIAIHEYMNADWWMGRNLRTGQEGIFPKTYVLVEQDSAKGAFAPQPQQQYAPQQPQWTPQPQYAPQAQYAQPQGPPPQQNPYNADVPPQAVAEQSTGGKDSKAGEMGKKFGKKLGNAAIFGAGATIGSNIVNSIF
ncbi:hypothetical protein EsH8_III_001203 [Colletotrichum jinshuiense]